MSVDTDRKDSEPQVIIDGVVRPSATIPDWSREEPERLWDPSRRLIRTVRKYNYWMDSPSIFSRLMQKYWALHYRFWSVVCGAEIGIDSRNLGGGFLMPHPQGCLFMARRNSSVGPNCWIGAGVMNVFRELDSETISSRKTGSRIGGAVIIGSGAILVGDIDIGDYAVIGAGAVVLCDVPAGYKAVGNPARLIPPNSVVGVDLE